MNQLYESKKEEKKKKREEVETLLRAGACVDRVLDRPASGKKGSTGRNKLDCIRGKGVD